MAWINFQGLRERLDFAVVLRHYKVEMKPTKNQSRQQGFCPLPSHQGQRRSPSFSVDHHRKLWRCFGCNKGGNILDFCVRMEGKDPSDNRQVAEVARLVQDRFGLARTAASNTHRNAARPSENTTAKGDAQAGGSRGRPPLVVNPPLDFELKELNPNHPYLRDRGFLAETIALFGLGYCQRGMLAGRIAIPLHDSSCRLVGYAGRLVNESKADQSAPKYLFPGERERGGSIISFKKSLLVYNLHRLVCPVENLVVTEGFASVWWLTQHGCGNVVALMGADCSAEQAEQITKAVHRDGRVWILTDGDDAGERCAACVLNQIAQQRMVRWKRLAKGRQPTDFSGDEIDMIFD